MEKQKIKNSRELRILRIRNGISQETAAKELGISQTTFSRIERGLRLLDSKEVAIISSLVCVESEEELFQAAS